MAEKYYRWDGDDLVLFMRLQPRAHRDEILGLHANRLKISLTSAPVDGKANAVLRKFLAKSCGVATDKVILESGQTSRNKRIRVRNAIMMPKRHSSRNS